MYDLKSDEGVENVSEPAPLSPEWQRAYAAASKEKQLEMVADVAPGGRHGAVTLYECGRAQILAYAREQGTLTVDEEQELRDLQAKRPELFKVAARKRVSDLERRSRNGENLPRADLIVLVTAQRAARPRNRPQRRDFHRRLQQRQGVPVTAALFYLRPVVHRSAARTPRSRRVACGARARAPSRTSDDGPEPERVAAPLRGGAW